MAWLKDHVDHQGGECLRWPFATDARGYGRLHFDGNSRGAHRVMCLLTHGDPPSPEHEAAHTCGRGHEGCVNPKHLRWATKGENQRDRLQHGTSPRGTGNGTNRLSEADVTEIRRRLALGVPQTTLAAEYGVTNHAVSAISRGKTWAWLIQEA